MRKSFFKTLLIASATAATLAAATPFRAEAFFGLISHGGKVIAVDAAHKSFRCHWKTGDWSYKTNAKTVFRVGRRKGSWSNLKLGEMVRVRYHMAGKSRVADEVTIAAR